MLFELFKRIPPVLIAGLVAVILGVLALAQCERAANSRAEASLSAAMTKAVSDSGKDAVDAVGAVAAQNSVIDATTRENEHAIQSAQGAAAPVPAAVAGAGRDGLCQRRAYRCTPECLQRTAARGVGKAGAGCPAAR